ncbi:multidrug effflux MFS transporter [Saccharospirillum sp. HFRX-1]|uniref:multidrug effflux MFS transporter n=1 Tax=unclassified Saccharospirillum TaxID=2633430 RepID=UPI00371FEA95
MNTDLFKTALILGLMGALGPFAIDMYLPAMPTITADLATTTSATQGTLMSFFVAFGLSQLFYGPASDVLGRKPPLYFGLGLFAVASIGCALAPSIEWLIVLRFFQGVGAAAVMSIPRAVIRDRYTGAAATRLMSTVMLVISVAPMLAPMIGSAVIIPFGWRAVFIACALVTIVSVSAAKFGLPETLAPEDRAPFKFSNMMRAFKTLFADPVFMGLTLIGGMGMASFFSFLSIASFLYTDYYGLNPFQFSLFFAVNALGFFSTSQIAANLGNRFGSIAVVKWAVAGYATSALLLLTFVLLGWDAFPLLVAMLALTFAFLGLVIPTSMVLALEEHGPIAGTAASLGGTLQMVLGAVAIAILSALFNGTPVALVAGIATCATIAVVLSVVTLKTVEPATA